MLPAVICEHNIVARSMWMGVLSELVASEFPWLKLEALPGSEKEVLRLLETQSGIMLVVLSVHGGVDEVERSVRLFGEVMQHNHDSYVILSICDERVLNAVLSRCMRPAGILLTPLEKGYMQMCLRRVLSDYSALQATEGDGMYMLINTDRALHKVAYRDIVYFEAQDKLVRVCTRRNVLRFRKSMSAIEKELPEIFLRCHRSYIVNREYVECVELGEMMVCLRTKERVPFSRQYKEAVRSL